MRRSSLSRGFTLLEVVVALTILGLIAGVVFSSLRLALNSYEKSQQRIDEEARQRVLQDQIRRQLGSLFPLQPGASAVNQQLAAGQGLDPARQLLYTQVPMFYGTPDAVTFITVSPLILHRNPGLTVVRYGLSQDEYGRYYLGAMEQTYTGLDSFLQMVEIPPGKPLALVKNVETLAFDYYGFDEERQTYHWYESWSGEDRLSVPSAVRIHVNQQQLVVPINATFFGSRLQTGIQNLLRR